MPRILLILSIIFLSCNNDNNADPDNISRIDEVEMEEIYLSYQITGNEGDDKLNILIQLREEVAYGRTLVVGEAGSVKLDGETLAVDSSLQNGAYYEVQKPIDAFTGDHVITLEGPGGIKLEEKFRFAPMTITGGFPDTVSASGSLELALGGLEPTDYVRVVMSDTSFHSDGVNNLDTVTNGRLLLGPEYWKLLHKGPVHLELHREMERPTSNGDGAGGRLTITWVLMRDFILTD